LGEKLAICLTMLASVPKLGQPYTTHLSGPPGLRQITYRTAAK